MVINAKSALVLILIGLVAGCNFRTDKQTEELQSSQSWFAKIQRETLNPSCVRCHSGPAAKSGVSLSAYGELMDGRTSKGLPLVVPGDVTKSELVRVLRQGVMPPSGAVSDGQIAAIEKWIAAGANQNALLPETPPEPTFVPTPITEPEEPAKFSYLLKEIFSKRCTQCHSGETPKGDLDLSSYRMAMESGMIVAGKPEESALYLAVIDGYMPPRPPKLADAEVNLIHNWILDGAKDNR